MLLSRKKKKKKYIYIYIYISLSLRDSQLSGGLRGRGKNPLLQHAVQNQLYSRKRTEVFLILRFAEARGKQSRLTHRVQQTIHLQLILLSMRCRYLFFPASNCFRSSSVCSSRGGMSLTCPSASNETYVKNALHVLTLLSKRKAKS